MPDTITPEDQALIDAALEAGRVRKIETGVSGLPQFTWDGSKLSDGNGKNAMWGFGGGRSRNTTCSQAEIVRRRKAIQGHITAGLKTADVARIMKLSEATICKHRRYIELNGGYK